MGRFLKILLFVSFVGMGLVHTSRCTAQTVTDTAGNTAADTVQQGNEAVAPADANAGFGRKSKRFQPNPKKAGLYSSIVPGLGQVYNRDYWKVPVIYVGIGVAGYFFLNNLKNYQSFREAYIGRINNPYPSDKYVNVYTTDQLQQLQNDYNKYLNLTVLFSTIGYALQVIDAVTSAHLKNFDISRDISMRVLPIPVPNGAGMAVVVNFR